ncbi:MAG: flagellar hook-associated 2-like protein [Cycloclasticus sp.]|nr:flagellar hook-associated 2-like protein [Cycloclasticus sp.]MBG97307.1 flagellar hook-associated 2-like protein [Cycloclasticus sp.]HAI97117.1 flagellar hook-associated 2-like protein [Methylococcaceae bacterium]|tara:strand:+ start:837 stop:2234 length:1398 start_codon:yes stop_codon:yes gene_type:complete
MSISSPGIGSGLDINSLISQLVAAEGQNTANRLDLREAEYQANISAYGSLKGALSLFQTAVKNLQDVTDFQVRSATSSNSDIFTATADETADVSQYGIEVVQLAQAHKLITTEGFAVTDAIGGGTLTLTQGVNSFALTISATDTLEDVRDAVNGASDNSGVAASIINIDDGLGGTEQKLVFTSTSTGLENEITITVDDDDLNDTDGFGLSRLVNANLDVPAAALDGQIRVDNQLISSANDTFEGVVDGISITSVAVGAGERLTVVQDSASVTAKINTFIANYNGLVDTFSALGSYDSATETGGILVGDSTLRGIQNLIRREISSSVSGLTGSFSTLAELGITTDDTGKLTLDTDSLNDALDGGFDQVGELFAATNGIANTIDTVIEGYIGPGGIIESRTGGLQTSIDDIADQRDALNRRLESLGSRLLSQFSAMDALVSTLQNQSNFLTQQLANLPGVYKPNQNN